MKILNTSSAAWALWVAFYNFCRLQAIWSLADLIGA